MIEVNMEFRNEEEKRRWFELLFERTGKEFIYGWMDPEGQQPWEVSHVEVEMDGDAMAEAAKEENSG